MVLIAGLKWTIHGRVLLSKAKEILRLVQYVLRVNANMCLDIDRALFILFWKTGLNM